MQHEFLPNSSVEEDGSLNEINRVSEPAAANHNRRPTPSTLIEFPGKSRPVPEWRRQLSQRVREVQERKAREAAEELAAAREAGLISAVLPSAQLELVPDLEHPVMNPIVSKALERIERARRAEYAEPAFTTNNAVAAPVLAPVEDLIELPEQSATHEAQAETKPKLTVVLPPKPTAAPEPTPIFEQQELNIEPTVPTLPPRKRKPVRVISDGVDDPALSYLETCLSVAPLDSDSRGDAAGTIRRFFAGVLDLILVAMMVAPAAVAIQYSNGDWANPRTVGLMCGITAVVMFGFITVSIGLSGRTLGMRLIGLRAIDIRTGLIPSGGQAAKRGLAYVFSLAFLGLGLAYSLIDPDGRAVHDRFSNTMVIRD